MESSSINTMGATMKAKYISYFLIISLAAPMSFSSINSIETNIPKTHKKVPVYFLIKAGILGSLLIVAIKKNAFQKIKNKASHFLHWVRGFKVISRCALCNRLLPFEMGVINTTSHHGGNIYCDECLQGPIQNVARFYTSDDLAQVNRLVLDNFYMEFSDASATSDKAYFNGVINWIKK